MKILTEIIKDSDGSYSVWIDGTEVSSGWRKRDFAESDLKIILTDLSGNQVESKK